MGTIDDFKASFGEDALRPTAGRGPAPVWQPLCVCGHTERHHAIVSGGSFELRPTITRAVAGGRTFIHSQAFDGGCRGAMVNRGEETVLDEQNSDADPMTRIERFLATCPCTSFEEIAQVDRPSRVFNQRIPSDRRDPVKHPFTIGVRGFHTHLSNRKAAQLDPNWTVEEFERRFHWTHRVCALSRCEETDGVWPVYLVPSEPDRSELRCSKHR